MKKAVLNAVNLGSGLAGSQVSALIAQNIASPLNHKRWSEFGFNETWRVYKDHAWGWVVTKSQCIPDTLPLSWEFVTIEGNDA